MHWNLEDFNTSHVTVYRIKARCARKGLLNFNTSHVTVYLQRISVYVQPVKISIHLMLRFILLNQNI